MKDYIVRATAADDQIRAFAITSRGLVEEARTRHNTSPVATAALGRLLSAGAMMGAMMKGDQDLLTLQIKCSGPIQGLTVTADAKGNVKGFVESRSNAAAKQQREAGCGRSTGSGNPDRDQRHGTQRALLWSD